MIYPTEMHHMSGIRNYLIIADEQFNFVGVS